MTKCIKFKKIRKRVCADFVGGKKGVRGQPGKKCRRYKTVTVRVCADFSPKGHGKLSKEQREKIRMSVHAGAFGGKGVMSSLKKCKIEVRKQKARGVPKALVIKRLALIKTWNKRKNPILSRRANQCMQYAREIYS